MKKLIKYFSLLSLIFPLIFTTTGCGGNDNTNENEEKYTITLNVDGTNEKKTVIRGNKFERPETDPIKQGGYVFEGWYTDSSFNSLYNFDSIPDSDFSLYAKFVLEYTPINFGEVKSYTGKTQNSQTKLEYTHNTDKKASINIIGLGASSVKILKSSDSSVVLNETGTDTYFYDLELSQGEKYKIIISGLLSSIVINETLEKELNTLILEKEETITFDNGEWEMQFFAHLSGSYEFGFNKRNGLVVTIRDLEDNEIFGDWINYKYTSTLTEDNWYKIKVVYSGTEIINCNVSYDDGDTLYENDSLIRLKKDNDSIYKAIIKPEIGSKVLLSGYYENEYNGIKSIKIYDKKRNLIKSAEDLENFVSLSFVPNETYYYVECTFSRYNSSSNLIYYINTIENDTTTNDLRKNTTVAVEGNRTTTKWFKFVSLEKETYKVESSSSVIILDEEFNYVAIAQSGSELQLEENEIRYIGLLNNSQNSYTLTIKDSFDAANNMTNTSWSNSINRVYKLSPSITLKYRWTFSREGISVIIMNENHVEISTYTSSSQGEKYTTKLNAGTNYYIRIIAQESGSVKFQKQENPATIQEYTRYPNDNTYISTMVYGNEITKYQINNSGYYKIYSKNPSKSDSGNSYLKAYILDNDLFKEKEIEASYKKDTDEYIYQTVYLERGYVYIIGRMVGYRYSMWIGS